MINELVFTVEFNIKPEAREAFLTSLNQVLDHMANEQTFVSCYQHQEAGDANKFVIYERWSEPSMEAFMENQFHGKAYREDYEAKLPQWLAEPRKISVLEPIGEWLS